MFSLDVNIRPSDIHTIFSLSAPSKPINQPNRGVFIGDHVWIGHRVMILKEVIIPNGCIVGALSLVTRKIFNPNSIIGGSPAKVIKEGFSWDRSTPSKYVEKLNKS